MQFSTLTIIAAVLVTSPFKVLAWPSSSSSAAPTGTCYTITQTNAPPCTTPSPCTVEDCMTLSTITQSCGCASIYTTDICLSTCPLGCQVSYVTMYLPCATSVSSPTSSPTSSSSSSSSGSSSSSPSNSSSVPTTSSSVPYGNSTTTTVTSISTLTTCPASCTCSGQKTVWTGTSGPYSCSKTCSVVLPGGGTTTVTGATVVTKAGPTPTTSASSTGPSQVQASDGKKRTEVGGILAGLFGFLALL